MGGNYALSSIRTFRAPLHVDFNVTNGCNLLCSHCHRSVGSLRPDELTAEEILSAIRQLHSLGVISIAFAGGEPFIRKDILEILRFACSLPGWSVKVISNGVFLRSAQFLDELAQSCPGLAVNISLDGPNGLQQNYLRKHRTLEPNELFSQVVEGINRTRNAGLRTSVNFAITRQSIHNLLNTYDYVFNELKLSSMVAIKFFPGGFGRQHLDALEIPFIEWAELFASVIKMRIDGYLPGLQVSVPAAWEFYLPLIFFNVDINAAETAWNYRAPLREDGYAEFTSVGDSAGIGELAVAADGNIYPSILMIGNERFLCGNVRKQTIAQIWQSSQVLKFIRRLTIEDLDISCRQCELVSICGGGSRSRAVTHSDDYGARDYLCPLLRRVRDQVNPKPFAPSFTPDTGDLPAVRGCRIGGVTVLGDSAGCEVRTGRLLFRGNEEMSRIIALAIDRPNAADIESLARQYHITDSELLVLVRPSLKKITPAGCP